MSEGFVVDPARNGLQGIERAFNSVPDVVLVKLNLVDISGDMVIVKLKTMAKTRHVKCVLYTQRTGDRTVVAQKIGDKNGVDRFVEYASIQELVGSVRAVLNP